MMCKKKSCWLYLSTSLWGISLRRDLFRKSIDQYKNFLLQQHLQSVTKIVRLARFATLFNACCKIEIPHCLTQLFQTWHNIEPRGGAILGIFEQEKHWRLIAASMS